MTDAQLATVRLDRHRFHGDWNYTIHPAVQSKLSQLLSDRPLTSYDKGMPKSAQSKSAIFTNRSGYGFASTKTLTPPTPASLDG